MGQEQEQATKERDSKIKEVTNFQLERDQKKKEEEEKIAHLELEILKKINVEKQKDNMEKVKIYSVPNVQEDPTSTEESDQASNLESNSEEDWYWDDQKG